MKPLVSICIPTYNYGRFLRAAIDSGLAQTYPRIEVVVTDNASTDDTQEILAAYAAEPRVRVFRNPATLPMPENHWLALTRAAGEFVVNVPSDDVLLPRFVEEAHAAYERARGAVDVVYASLAYADETLAPRTTGACFGLLPCAYAGGRNEFRELLRMAHMRWQTLFTPKAVFEELGPLDASLTVQWDWEYFLRMAAAGKRFACVPTVHALARDHGGNASSAGAFVGTIRELEEYLAILTRYTAPEHAARMHGIEHTLSRHVEGLAAHIKARDPGRFTPEHDRRVAAYKRNLETAIARPAPPVPGAPETTVILPTTGARPAALHRALLALRAQTTDDFEIVVVQNGAESLVDWLETLGFGPRLRAVHLGTPIGAAAARNLGLKLAAGRFIAHCDDDAVFAPEHLARLAAALRQTGAEAAYAAAEIAIGVPSRDATAGEPVRAFALDAGAAAAHLTIADGVPLASVMHRYRAIDECGFFSESVGIHHDWLFLLAVGLRRGFVHVPLPGVRLDYVVGDARSVLGRLDGAGYVAALDALYAHLPGPLTEPQRRHRDAVERGFALYGASARGPAELEALLRTLAGPAGTATVAPNALAAH